MNNTMSYRGYTASMNFDADDKIIVGRVLDVDDITSFHGSLFRSSRPTSAGSWTTTSLPANNLAACPRSRPAESSC